MTEERAIEKDAIEVVTVKQGEGNDDEEQTATAERPKKYRRWLKDRTNGSWRLHESKPFCFACYVPLPVLWLADYIEQNSAFEFMGKIGLFSPDNLAARRICIGTALVLNILGFGLQFYTCFAVSQHYDTLEKVAFTRAIISQYMTTELPNYMRLSIGITAVGYNDYGKVNKGVVSFDTLCNSTLGGFEILQQAEAQEACEGCRDASSSMVATLFISLIMYFPNITTDVLRLYPHYDCNCQKVFASFAALISIGFALYTFMIYQFRCFRKIGWGYICLDLDGKNVDCDDVTVEDSIEIERYFFAGPGWIALGVAVGFKIFDMLLNIAIPTPTICRDHEEQRQYELLFRVDPDAAECEDAQAEELGEERTHPCTEDQAARRPFKTSKLLIWKEPPVNQPVAVSEEGKHVLPQNAP
jgi:hypothetical protein